MLPKEVLSCIISLSIWTSCHCQSLLYLDNDINNRTTVWGINISNCCNAERLFTINASDLYLHGYYSIGNEDSIAWIGGNTDDSYDSLITYFAASNGNFFDFMANTGQKIRYLSMGYSVNGHCKDTSLVLTALQYNFDTNLINYGCLSVATGEFRGKPISESNQYNLFEDYQFGGGIHDDIKDALWATFYNESSWGYYSS